MIQFLGISFWLYFIYFVFVIFLAFYIPGVFFISRLKLSKFNVTVLSFITGMVLWGWQGFIFGYLNLRWLSYIYLFIFLFFWLRIHFKDIKKFNNLKLSINKKEVDFVVIILILFGVFIQLTSVLYTGVLTSKGLYFCCGNISDNILQISITNQIVKQFPPFEPGMYSVIIQNYHYWDSLVMGEMVRVFKLPLIPTDYQYMTVFISLFLGLSAITFSQILNLGRNFIRWLIFFLYFGGDFVWLMIMILRGRDFFAMNPLESGQQFLENIPRAVAIVVFFAFLSVFLLWIKRKDKKTSFLMTIFAATLIGFKIYIGIFVFCGLGMLSIFYILKKKYKLVLPFIFAIFMGLMIYLPVNSNAGGLYFTGTWRFENFIQQGYFGNLPMLELARLVYLQHNNWVKVTLYESFYILFFVLATFGTKLLGLIQNRKSILLLPKELNILLIAGMVVSAIAGFFFNQTTGGSNTFNFLVSVFIIGSIYSALACFFWLDKMNRPIKALLITIIVLFTLPRGIDQAYNNMVDIIQNKGFIILNKELSALNFISKQKNQALVIVDPNISMDMQSPYLSFLTNKNMFMSGQVDELEAHGINFSKRHTVRDLIFDGLNPASVSAVLLNNNIGYIYELSSDKLASTDSAKFLTVIFDNKNIKIMKVDRFLAKSYLKNYESLNNQKSY